MGSERTIVISGVGGQGVITLARILGYAAFKEGYKVSICETHGLSHRLGSVYAIVRYGLEACSSVIKSSSADMLISLDLIEALRYAYMIKRGGVLLTSDVVSWIFNKDLIIARKEALRKLSGLSNTLKFIVKNIDKNPLNTFILGVACKVYDLKVRKETIISVLKELFTGENLERNIIAFKNGLKAEVYRV